MAYFRPVFNILDYGAIGNGTNDDALAMQTAITAAAASNGVVFIPTGSWTWKTVPVIPVTKAVKIVGAGTFSTTIVLSSAGYSALAFQHVGDYDTLQQIELMDFTVDATSISTSANRHVVIGTFDAAGNWLQRCNIKNMTIKRVRTLNVPKATGGTAVHNVSFVSKHVASGETNTVVQDILIEDCDFQGGNFGVSIGGSVGSGTACNVIGENIFLSRVKHDVGVAPTAVHAGDANFQIGINGKFGTVRMHDCRGTNSSDTGFEVDTVQDFVGLRCVAVDSWNKKFFNRNYQAPSAVDVQKNTWRDCTAINSGVDRVSTGATSSDYMIGGDGSTSAYIFGELLLDGCKSQTLTPCATPNTTGWFVDAATGNSANGVQFRQLSIHNHSVGAPNIAITASTTTAVFFDIRSLLAGAYYDISGIDIDLDGTRSTGTGGTWKVFRIEGSDFHCHVNNVGFNLGGITGMGSGTDTFYWLLFASDHASTGRPYVSGLRCLATPGGTHNGVTITAGNMTLPQLFVIERCDLSKLPANAGFDYNIPNDANITGKVAIRNVISQRSGTSSGPLQASASVALPPAVAAPTFSGASTTGGFLTGGTTYFYKVNAIVTYTTGTSQTPTEIEVAGVEASNAVPAGTNTNQITVNWSASAGATGYKIYRGTNTGGELLLATLGSVTSYVDNTNTTPVGAFPAGITALYRNVNNVPVQLVVSGGTITSLIWSMDNATNNPVGFTNGILPLEPGWYVRLSYSSAPSLTKLPAH